MLTTAAALLLAYSLGLSRLAGWIPRVTLTMTVLLLVVQSVAGIRRQMHEIVANDRAPRLDDAPQLDAQGSGSASMTPAAAMRWLVGHTVAVLLFGAAAGPGLFCLVYMRCRAGEAWRTSALFAAALAASLYVVLELVFRAGLFRGVLWGLRW